MRYPKGGKSMNPSCRIWWNMVEYNMTLSYIIVHHDTEYEVSSDLAHRREMNHTYHIELPEMRSFIGCLSKCVSYLFGVKK